MTYIAIGLLVLLFLPLVWLGAKTWHWLHVTAVVFLFGASVSFMIAASHVANLHLQYKPRYASTKAQVEKKNEEILELESGPRNVVPPPVPGNIGTASENPDAPLSTCRIALARIIIDRGRVWRGCQITAANAAAGQFEVVTALGEGVEKHGIVANDVLYVFAETATLDDGRKLPKEYVGEYKVTAATNNAVTLNLTTGDGVDGAHTLLNQSVTLSLYALMPIDGHIFFAATESLSNFQPPVFGDMLTAADLKSPQVFTDPVGYRPDQPGALPRIAQLYGQDGAILDAITNEYARDGGGWREGDRPENHWVRVQFLKPYEFAADSVAEQGVTAGFYFDPTNGRAEVPTLRNPGAVEGQVKLEAADYAINDFALFPFNEETQSLIDQQICQPTDNIYVRQLNDYAFAFHRGFQVRSSLFQYDQLVREEIASLQRAQQRTDRQINARETERDKLTSDKGKFDREQEVAADYLNTLNQKWGSLQAELSRLYQENVTLEEQLSEISEQVTQSVEADVKQGN